MRPYGGRLPRLEAEHQSVLPDSFLFIATSPSLLGYRLAWSEGFTNSSANDFAALSISDSEASEMQGPIIGRSSAIRVVCVEFARQTQRSEAESDNACRKLATTNGAAGVIALLPNARNREMPMASRSRVALPRIPWQIVGNGAARCSAESRSDVSRRTSRRGRNEIPEWPLLSSRAKRNGVTHNGE